MRIHPSTTQPSSSLRTLLVHARHGGGDQATAGTGRLRRLGGGLEAPPEREQGPRHPHQRHPRRQSGQRQGLQQGRRQGQQRRQQLEQRRVSASLVHTSYLLSHFSMHTVGIPTMATAATTDAATTAETGEATATEVVGMDGMLGTIEGMVDGKSRKCICGF